MTAASRVVTRQVDAYNAHDLEGFLAWYAADVVIRSGEGAVLMQGLHEMRESYGARFLALTGLHAEIRTRIELDTWVVDEEHVTAEGLDLHAVVAYRVRDGLIDQVVMMIDEGASRG